MGNSDIIGGRGEAIPYARLTKFCRPDDVPYCLPHYLGEKCQTFDYLVELIDAGESTPYFFVQVKATRKEFTKKQVSPRLVVGVTKQDIRRMVAFPAPTYVVGVHEDEERAFVVSVHEGMSEAIPSITTGHELNCDTLKRLWEEVRDFWQARDIARTTSQFLN